MSPRRVAEPTLGFSSQICKEIESEPQEPTSIFMLELSKQLVIVPMVNFLGFRRIQFQICCTPTMHTTELPGPAARFVSICNPAKRTALLEKPGISELFSYSFHAKILNWNYKL